MTWLASLVGGPDVLAEADTLEDLFLALNQLDLAEDAEIAAFWTGDDVPPEFK